MDSTTSHIPSPSMAWSHLASTHVGESPAGTPIASTSNVVRREDEAAQLRARLLRMIEHHDHLRKAAATEAQNSR